MMETIAIVIAGALLCIVVQLFCIGLFCIGEWLRRVTQIIRHDEARKDQ